MEYYDKYNLLIVESPTKAQTISKYLKEDEDEWIVRSTKGHLLDLPPKEMGLEYEDGQIEAKWVYTLKDTKKIISELKQLSKNAETVFIATDDDREGERIADEVFKARANEMVFNGWEIVSEHILSLSKEQKSDSWKDDKVRIPKLKPGDKLYPLEIYAQDHNTRKPPRYGVGTFIAAVHKMGFARPSTIGTIINRLVEKGDIVS
jgi:DNA topoisomerase IA